jgi:hypothetical protein
MEAVVPGSPWHRLGLTGMLAGLLLLASAVLLPALAFAELTAGAQAGATTEAAEPAAELPATGLDAEPVTGPAREQAGRLLEQPTAPPPDTTGHNGVTWVPQAAHLKLDEPPRPMDAAAEATPEPEPDDDPAGAEVAVARSPLADGIAALDPGHDPFAAPVPVPVRVAPAPVQRPPRPAARARLDTLAARAGAERPELERARQEATAARTAFERALDGDDADAGLARAREAAIQVEEALRPQRERLWAQQAQELVITALLEAPSDPALREALAAAEELAADLEERTLDLEVALRARHEAARRMAAGPGPEEAALQRQLTSAQAEIDGFEVWRSAAQSSLLKVLTAAGDEPAQRIGAIERLRANGGNLPGWDTVEVRRNVGTQWNGEDAVWDDSATTWLHYPVEAGRDYGLVAERTHTTYGPNGEIADHELLDEWKLQYLRSGSAGATWYVHRYGDRARPR